MYKDIKKTKKVIPNNKSDEKVKNYFNEEEYLLNNSRFLPTNDINRKMVGSWYFYFTFERKK
ncbi:hypothetical protein PIROE2DRAFT_17146 [Piromyces sp. E2]|nr:hypothetical protein PIROE2DRAFT_17146 [Piromyces sp. E2]|eukprot:OUM57769.1 hypothetical protein PIROE2DRAFT_17146 [Piromyces sp. E2]